MSKVPVKVGRATAAAVVVLLVAATAVFAATDYWSTLRFQGEHQGATRSYVGRDMNISYDTYIAVNAPHQATTYTVYLYRHSCFLFFCSDDRIGQVTAPYVGHAFGRWTNVGSADYFFLFVKPRDNVSLASDSVHMYSRN
jgi:hypothetical protein